MGNDCRQWLQPWVTIAVVGNGRMVVGNGRSLGQRSQSWATVAVVGNGATVAVVGNGRGRGYSCGQQSQVCMSKNITTRNNLQANVTRF